MGEGWFGRWPVMLLALCLGTCALAFQTGVGLRLPLAQLGMLAALGAFPPVLLAYCAQVVFASAGVRRAIAPPSPVAPLSWPLRLIGLTPVLLAWGALGLFVARWVGWFDVYHWLSVASVAHGALALLLLAPSVALAIGCLLLLAPHLARRIGLIQRGAAGRSSPLLACTLALAVGPLALTQAAPLAFGVRPALPIAILALTPLVFPLGLALATALRAGAPFYARRSRDRWQALEFALVDRVIVYTLLTLPLFTLYIGAGVLIGQLVAAHSLLYAALLTLALAVMTSVTYAPLRAWIQRMVDSLVYRDYYTLDEILQRVSQGLATLQRQDEIANYLLDILMETLNLTGAAFVYLPDGLDRRLLNMLEVGDVRARGACATSPGATTILDGLRALDVEQLTPTWRSPVFCDPWPGCAALLMIGPGHGGEARALVVIAPKRSHSSLRREDYTLLAMIASQTAMALANAQLIDGLRNSLTQTQVTTSQLAKATVERELMLRELVGADDRQRAALARELHDDALQDALYVARHSQLCVRLAEDMLRTIEPPELLDPGEPSGVASATGPAKQEAQWRIKSSEEQSNRQVIPLLRRLLDEGERVIARAKLVEQKLRALCLGLYPETLNSLGLAAALNELAERAQGEQPTIEVSSFCDGMAATVAERLNRRASLHMYRIAQEALQNASKHGNATAIALRLTTNLSAQPSVNSIGDIHPGVRPPIVLPQGPNMLILEARDDGQGMTLPVDVEGLLREGRLGLAGMHERALALGGTLRLQQGLDGGSVVTLSVPLTERVLDQSEQSAPPAHPLVPRPFLEGRKAPETPRGVFQIFPLTGAPDMLLPGLPGDNRLQHDD